MINELTSGSDLGKVSNINNSVLSDPHITTDCYVAL